jgi:hypothetical protein
MQPTSGAGTVPPREEISTRSLFIDNSEIQLATWHRRLSRVAEDANALEGEARAILEGRIQQLEDRLVEAREELDAMKGATVEYWEEIKAQFEATWDEIVEIFNRTDPPRGRPNS